MGIDWDHVLLLGYYGPGPEHRSYLSSWIGERKTASFAISGCNVGNVPLGRSPVPDGSKLISVPDGDGAFEFVDRINCLVGIGWYFEEGLDPTRAQVAALRLAERILSE